MFVDSEPKRLHSAQLKNELANSRMSELSLSKSTAWPRTHWFFYVTIWQPKSPLGFVKYSVSRWQFSSCLSISCLVHNRPVSHLPYPSCGFDKSKIVYDIWGRKEHIQPLQVAVIRDVAERENICKSHFRRLSLALELSSLSRFLGSYFWDIFQLKVVQNIWRKCEFKLVKVTH